MFNKNYEQRLSSWRKFRESLETAEDPLQAVIDFYAKVPLVKYQCDPYDRDTWPSPWEIIQENTYCPFVKLLAICYSLQLTDKFLDGSFEIHIKYDPVKSAIYYLLYVNDRVLGFTEETHVHKNDIPSHLVSQQVFPMKPLQ